MTRSLRIPTFVAYLALRAFPALAAAESGATEPYAQHLLRWQVREARAIAEDAVRERRLPADLFALAQVRFFEARYADALELLREAKSKASLGPSGAKFERHVHSVWRTASQYSNVDSAHFSLRFDATRDRVLVEPALECLEKAYDAIGEDLGFVPEGKAVVEICPNAGSFAVATTLAKEDIDRSGTIAICKFNRVVITSPRVTLHGYGWQDTLCHEYVHYVLMKKTGNRVPLWLHEGIAKYEETRWRSSRVGPLPPLLASLLAEAVETDALVSFDRMHPTFAKLDGRDASLAFAQVSSMLSMIVQEKGLRGLRLMLDALRDGQSPDQALRRVMGVDVKAFEARWLMGIKRQKLVRLEGLALWQPRLKRHPEGKDRQSDDVEALQDAVSKRAADLVRLGDLLRGEHRPKAAVAEYRKADAAAGVLSPIIRTRLAFAHVENHDLAAAAAALATVQKVYRDYQPAAALSGAIHLRQRAYPQAVADLKHAVAINPFDYVARATLAEAYQQTGQRRLEQEQRQAIQLILRKENPKTHEQ